MERVMDQFDLLVTRVNEIGATQTQMKQQMDIQAAAMDEYTSEQHLIAQQVLANGAAVAQLTLQQFDQAEMYKDGEFTSVTSEDSDHQALENIFASKKPPPEVGHSKHQKPPPKQPKHKDDKDPKLPNHSMPKMQFPKFDGTDPKIWKDNCESYFDLYKLPEGMWVTAARIHLEGNAAKWYQAYKQNHTFKNWSHFCSVVEEEFGSDDFRSALNDLLELKQQGQVEEYTTQFQSRQYQVNMHNSQYDDIFYTTQYMRGLKDELRGTVEAQMPTTVLKASIIAKIQQGVLERAKAKQTKHHYQQRTYQPQRQDIKPHPQAPSLWRDRQLRDYRKANGLCYSCGEKYVPGHIEVCTKRNRPQVNALVLNDLDRELSDEVLNDLAAEDVLQEDFGKLSLNALSGTDSVDCIKLKARVKDKTMLILVDSGSTHSFISSHFVQLAQLPVVPIPARQVKLANGQVIMTDSKVCKLPWFCQGSTLYTDMIVLDMHPYDAILGFDWLTAHSPMNCDWQTKTLEFSEGDRTVHLQGLQ